MSRQATPLSLDKLEQESVLAVFAWGSRNPLHFISHLCGKRAHRDTNIIGLSLVSSLDESMELSIFVNRAPNLFRTVHIITKKRHLNKMRNFLDSCGESIQVFRRGKKVSE